MVVNGANDLKLMQRIAAKDGEALRELVQRHQHRILNLCLKFVRNAQDAEDLAQDVFVEVWKHAGRFKGEAEVSTWLHRIAVNRSLNHIRKHRRSRDIVPADETLPEPAPAEQEPDRMLESAQARALLHRALDQLPEKQRVPFVLSKLEGMSYAEIADVLRISVANVESRIHRAKLSLQKLLIEILE